MDTLSLSLRQRQLIHFLQLRTTYTTGEELAEHLHVSSRTIRHDIIEINDSLKIHLSVFCQNADGDIY